MITPESIEAIPPTDIKQIAALASELHEATVGALELMSIEDVRDQEDLRASMKIKLTEAMSELKKQQEDISATRRHLGILKSYQTSDQSRIVAYKFSLISSHKEGRA